MLRMFYPLAALAVLSACMDGKVSSGNGERVLSTNLSGGFRDNEALKLIGTNIPNHQPTLVRSGKDQTSGKSYFYTSQKGAAEIRSTSSNYSPNSPSHTGWIIRCNQDRMTDRRYCKINPSSSGRAILDMEVNSSGRPRLVCILGHDFPGRRGRLRIDANPAITTSTSGCISGSAAARFGQQLANGQTLLVERVEWPKDYGKQRSYDVRNGYLLAQELFRYSKQRDQGLFATGGKTN